MTAGSSPKPAMTSYDQTEAELLNLACEVNSVAKIAQPSAVESSVREFVRNQSYVKFWERSRQVFTRYSWKQNNSRG